MTIFVLGTSVVGPKFRIEADVMNLITDSVPFTDYLHLIKLIQLTIIIQWRDTDTYSVSYMMSTMFILFSSGVRSHLKVRTPSFSMSVGRHRSLKCRLLSWLVLSFISLFFIYWRGQDLYMSDKRTVIRGSLSHIVHKCIVRVT